MSSSAIVVGFIAVVTVGTFVLSNADNLVWPRGKFGLPRLLKRTEARIDDLPSLVDSMSAGSASVRYAGLIFNTPDRPSDEDTLNIQVSMEDGKAGFDWLLLAPRNIEDRESFLVFAHEHGMEPVARSENGVSYLRVECPDVAKFTASVVTDMYHYPPDEPLGLVYEGFDWPKG